MALRVLEVAANLVRLLVLARLLGPVPFGLFGLALLAVTALDTFTNIGLLPALIQTRKPLDSYLPTAWSLSLLRGAILGSGALFLGPTIARFFSRPELGFIVQILGITLVLSGAVNPRIVELNRGLRFRERFFFEGSALLAELVTAISSTFVLRGVWPLVLGFLARSLVRLVGSYVVVPLGGIRFRIGLTRVRELLTFGKWIGANGVLIFLMIQGDDVIVGKLLGAAALGLYQMAYRLSNIVTTALTHVTSVVTFPAYAGSQGNRQELARLFRKTLGLVSLVTFPLFFAIQVFAPDAIRMLLGESWLPMVPALRILAVWGVGRSLSATVGPLFNGVGRPRVNTFIQLAKLIILAAGLYPLTVTAGLTGTALALAVASIIMDPFSVLLASRVVGLGWRDLAAELLPPLASSALLGVAAVLVRRQLGGFHGLVQLTAAFCIPAAGYLWWHRQRILALLSESALGEKPGLTAPVAKGIPS